MKLAAGVLTFALVAGLAAVVTLSLPQPAEAGMCIYDDEPFLWSPSECKPPPGTKKVGKVVYINLYECLGHYDPGGTPCQCTYLGCFYDRTQSPAQEPDL